MNKDATIKNHYVEFKSSTTSAIIEPYNQEETSSENNDSIEYCNYNKIFKKQEALIRLILDLSWSAYVKSNMTTNTSTADKEKDLFSLSYFAKTAGQGLDMKQTAAYEIMCCSYILKSIEKHNLFQDEMELKIQNMFGDNLGNQIITKNTLHDHLKKRGGKSDLIMFLSGNAGAGKSLAIMAVRNFCNFF